MKADELLGVLESFGTPFAGGTKTEAICHPDAVATAFRQARALLAVARAADSEAIWQGDDRDEPALHSGWRRLGKALLRLSRLSSPSTRRGKGAKT